MLCGPPIRELQQLGQFLAPLKNHYNLWRNPQSQSAVRPILNFEEDGKHSWMKPKEELWSGGRSVIRWHFQFIGNSHSIWPFASIESLTVTAHAFEKRPSFSLRYFSPKGHEALVFLLLSRRSISCITRARLENLKCLTDQVIKILQHGITAVQKCKTSFYFLVPVEVCTCTSECLCR